MLIKGALSVVPSTEMKTTDDELELSMNDYSLYTPTRPSSALEGDKTVIDNIHLAILFVGNASQRAVPWLAAEAHFSVDVFTAEHFKEVQGHLNGRTLDICVVDAFVDQNIVMRVLSHIAKYQMHCATIVLNSFSDINKDQFFLDAGATDVCRYEDFDRTTVSHIVRSTHLRAKNNIQHRQELSRLSGHLYNVANELKNPLNVIQGHTQVLKRTLADKTSKLNKEYFERVLDSSARITHLMDDLLDLGGVTTGRISLNLTKVNVRTVVEEVVNQLAAVAEEHELSLTFQPTSDGHDFYVQADALRLYQIVSNLISNGLKYTEEGGVTISLSWFKKEQWMLCLDVVDTGIGIEEKNLEAIFDLHQRVDHKIDKKVNSTGLGLPITLELVNQHHGTISVKSCFGVGSVFRVYLPKHTPISISAAQVH